MNDKLKIVIVVVCVVLVVVFIAFRQPANGGGLDSLKGQSVHTKCVQCGDAAKTDAREYFAKVADKTTSQNAQPLLTCDKCGKDGVTEAMECEKCSNIFIPKDKFGDYNDKCPQCGFSKRESLRAKKSQ